MCDVLYAGVFWQFVQNRVIARSLQPGRNNRRRDSHLDENEVLTGLVRMVRRPSGRSSSPKR